MSKSISRKPQIVYTYLSNFRTRKHGKMFTNVEHTNPAHILYRKNALFSIKLYGCNTTVWVEIKNSLRQSYIQLPNIVFKILQCPNKANQCIAMSSYYIHTCNIWHMSPECNTYYVHIFLNQTSTKVLLGYHKPSIETFSAVQL